MRQENRTVTKTKKIEKVKYNNNKSCEYDIHYITRYTPLFPEQKNL